MGGYHGLIPGHNRQTAPQGPADDTEGCIGIVYNFDNKIYIIVIEHLVSVIRNQGCRNVRRSGAMYITHNDMAYGGMSIGAGREYTAKSCSHRTKPEQGYIEMCGLYWHILLY